MQLGDFTKLAKDYIHRTGYSHSALKLLKCYIETEMNTKSLTVADVGAGTGKLTENLFEIGLNGFAVEPNDMMRAEGQNLNLQNKFTWSKGTGEETGLKEGCAHWVFMASSFHWTNQPVALKEFKRVLKSRGFFTCLWNPRDLERSEFHMMIEKKIHEIAPQINRVSSGSKSYTQGIEKTLISTGDFEDVLFVEAQHEVKMTPERYLGAWKSVNDIQAQAGPEKWNQILSMLEKESFKLPEILVPYKTRSWTARRKN